MKRLFCVLSIFLAGLVVYGQQNQPYYIMYTPGCMDQLEYRYTYQSTVIPAYSVRPNAAEQYILTAATPGINTPTLPSGTIRCQDLSLQEGFLNMANSQQRAVYVVHQTAQGYTMMPVIAATKVTRQGSLYIFQAPTYSFALDTLRLENGVNLALTNSTSYVFLNGSKRRGCAVEYSFRREPTLSTLEKSDFDFVPGVGITNDRTGLNAGQAESNHIRLISVNGRFLDDYLGGNCPNQPQASVSKWTQPVQYSTTTPAVREADKEAWSASQNPQTPVQYSTATPAGLPPLANCPELPGSGYHIAQPGDNINAIARTYDVSVKNLLAWNKIKDADKIEVCQKIYLSKPPANAAAAASKGAAERPATYNYTTSAPQKEVVNQSAYWNTQAAPAAVLYSATPDPNQLVAKQPTTPSVHVVQRGETLYGISQRYRVTETSLREYNRFPAQGEVTLHPGDRVVLCNCQPDQAVIAPNPAAAGTNPVVYNYQAPSTAQPQPQPQVEPRGAYTPTSSIGTNPTAAGIAPTATSPVTYSTTPASGTSRETFDPNRPLTSSNPTNTTTPSQPGVSTANPTSTTPTDTSVPARPPVYQEYYVRQGDTIGSVAVQFRVSAEELALVNGKEINETLVAGQRLLIPKY